MNKHIDISIIIVTYNVANLIRDCLNSINYNNQLSIEIIIVDSGSTDNLKEVIEDFKNIKKFFIPYNIGITKGNNIGIKNAKGRYLLFLNPDTELHTDTLNHLYYFLEKNSEISIVGPHTLNSDGSSQPTRRRFHSIRDIIFTLNPESQSERKFKYNILDNERIHQYINGFNFIEIKDGLSSLLNCNDNKLLTLN